MKREHPVDKLFKEKLEAHHIEPSEAVWQKISGASGPQRDRSGTGGYFLRAAVITLMIGLSTLLYFNNNQGRWTETSPVTKAEGKETNPAKTSPGSRPEKSKMENENPGGGREDASPKKSDGKSKRQITPVIRHSLPHKQLLVNNEEALLIVPEPVESPVEDVAARIEDHIAEKPASPGIKLKYTVPVTAKTFYADEAVTAHEEQGLKEKVFAYANNQVENLLNGEPLELPETERKGKPQLEINLGKIF